MKKTYSKPKVGVVSLAAMAGCGQGTCNGK